MPDTVKRLNYYDHQFLRVPDFTDEQSYNLSMRRLHNSALHTWGIVRGLGVVPVSGGTGTAVTVSAGFALDSAGREIVLAADTNLELGGVAAGTTLYITIAYDEQPSDPPTEGGGSERTRITEAPKLSFSATAPADASVTLILARVPRVGSNGLGTVDGSDRRQAGVALGNDITVMTLTLKNGGVAQANWPVLSCSAANQLNLASAGLVVNGTLRATGAVRFDSTLSYGDSSSRTEWRDDAGLQGNAGAQSGFFQTEKPVNYPSGATSWWHLLDVRHTNSTNNYALQIAGSLFDQDLYFRKTNNSASTAWNKFIYANSAGNVGIGTASPTLGKLQTAGVVGSTAAVFASDSQGIALVASWPNIGFNSYFNGGWKAINTGYGGAVGVDEGVGGLHFHTADTVTGQGTPHVHLERMRITNTGNVGIGTGSPLAFLHVDTGNTPNSGLILTKAASKPAFGILPWDSEVYLSAGVTYQNNAWVHQSDTKDSLLLTLDPGSGVKWYASNTGSVSWNVANGVSQWDTAGYWKNLVQSTAPGNSYFTGGNVGIGVMNPEELLHVNGRVRAGALTVGSWPADPGYVFFGTMSLDQANAGNYALLQAFAKDTPGRTFLNSPVDIRFRISNADRMVLNANGSVSTLVGSNQLNFTSAWSNTPDTVTNGAEISNDTKDYKTLMIVGNRSNGGPRRVSVWDRLEVNGDLHVTQNVTKQGGAATWTVLSDKVLKKDIAPIEGALEKILRLRGVSFAWREPEQHNATNGRYMGMVAQEVEKVFPEWVRTVPSGHKGIDLIGFEALVVEALRQLGARCERLEAELAELRGDAAEPKAATPARKKS